MRIGIVNDLPGINELLRRIVDLTRNHHVIWMAQSGAEAVELCSKETPDLILMDLVMPGMNGAELTRRIMASTPCAILIVTVSMRDNAGLVLDALTHGAIDAVDIPTLTGGRSTPCPGSSVKTAAPGTPVRAHGASRRWFVPTG
jgi:chemotaxis response regulator CheB